MEHVACKMVDRKNMTRLLREVCQQTIAGKHVLKARSVKAMRRMREESANYMKKGCRRSTATRTTIATTRVTIRTRAVLDGVAGRDAVAHPPPTPHPACNPPRVAVAHPPTPQPLCNPPRAGARPP